MKIAYVTMQFPEPSETFASTDVRTLVELGDSITVFAMRPPHPNHSKLVAERSHASVDIRSLTMRRALRGLVLLGARPGWTWSLIAWIFKWNWRRPRHVCASLALLPSALMICADIVREGFDVVHLFWGHYPAMVGHLVEHFASETVRSVFLGAYDLHMAYGGSGPVARNADVVWTHTEANVGAILRLDVNRAKIHVVHRGVDVAMVERTHRSGADVRVSGRIVTVGRLISAKGVHDVIRGFEEVRKRLPESTLCIVGSGPERAKLEALARDIGASDAVEFLGHVPHVEVLRAMARAEVFILLSSLSASERLPNAAKEAMMMGCVTIVTATPGIEELVRHEQTGFVADSTDAAAVARLLERALMPGRDLEGIRDAAQRHVRESFDVVAAMNAYRVAWTVSQRSRSPASGRPPSSTQRNAKATSRTARRLE